MTDRRPIATAPRDGTPILAYCKDRHGSKGEFAVILWDTHAERYGLMPWRVGGVEDRLTLVEPVWWTHLPEVSE